MEMLHYVDVENDKAFFDKEITAEAALALSVLYHGCLHCNNEPIPSHGVHVTLASTSVFRSRYKKPPKSKKIQVINYLQSSFQPTSSINLSKTRSSST